MSSGSTYLPSSLRAEDASRRGPIPAMEPLEQRLLLSVVDDAMAQAAGHLTDQLAWNHAVIQQHADANDGKGFHLLFNVLDWSIGRTYKLEAGSLVDGSALVDELRDAQGEPQAALPNAIDPDEDSWSLVKVREVMVDELTNPNLPAIWSDAVDRNWEIVGIVYGGVDEVVWTQANGTQVVGTVGEKFAFFIQPEGTLDVKLGSSGRVAAKATSPDSRRFQ